MTQPAPVPSSGKWGRWAMALSVALPLGVFLWTQYETSAELRREMQTEIATNNKVLELLTARLDAQRDDITALRQQLIDHARLEAEQRK